MTGIYILVVILNRIAIRKKKDYFKPIHRHASPFSCFEAFIKTKMGDTCKVEEHTIKMKDGHLIKCHRVQLKQNLLEKLQDKRFVGKPVYCQPPFAGSSELVFEVCGKYFVEKGFDVWLTNYRGSRYCLFHENEDISYEDFYDFNGDDYAMDVRDNYEYIIKQTGYKKIIFAGNSVGGEVFAMSHSRIEDQDFFKDHTEQAILIVPLLYPYLQSPKAPLKLSDESLEFFLKKAKELGIHHYSMLFNFEDHSFLQLEWLMQSTHKGWDLTETDLLQSNWEVDNIMFG